MLAPLRGGHRHNDDRATNLPEILSVSATLQSTRVTTRAAQNKMRSPGNRFHLHVLGQGICLPLPRPSWRTRTVLIPNNEHC
jgi:hypothetical protein